MVKEILSESCNIIKWKRKESSIYLSEEISSDNTLLVYPGGDSEECSDLSSIENFILIDGTWQESNKIFNRTPYLKRFNRFSFSQNLKSSYTLRRNQKNNGLCTIESVIEIYKLKGQNEIAEKLESIFTNFQKL